MSVRTRRKNATTFDGEGQQHAKHLPIVVRDGLATFRPAVLVKTGANAIELHEYLDAILARDVMRWRLSEL